MDGIIENHNQFFKWVDSLEPEIVAELDNLAKNMGLSNYHRCTLTQLNWLKRNVDWARKGNDNEEVQIKIDKM